MPNNENLNKIRPYNDDKWSFQSSKNKRNKLNLSILFVNKTIEMINLPIIIRNKPLKSFAAFCSIKNHLLYIIINQQFPVRYLITIVQ